MTTNGTSEVTSVIVEHYDGIVYNYIFMEDNTPNYIEANGYWSGEFYTEKERTQRRLTDEEKAIGDEMRKLAEELRKLSE